MSEAPTNERTIDPEELVGRLERVWAGGAKDDPKGAPVLAFDADGTLWTGDVGDDFFEALLHAGDVLDVAERAMQRELDRANVPRPEGKRASQAIFDAYHANAFDEERFYEIVGWAAAGRTKAEIEAYADRVQAARGLDDRLHVEVKPVLAWAKTRGVDVYVVSASPRVVVQRGVRRHGIEPDFVFGARAQWDSDGDVMLADAVRPIPYGGGKVKALRARIGEAPILAAFGDNVFDLEMMKEAAFGVMVRPKPRLLNADTSRFYRLKAPM